MCHVCRICKEKVESEKGRKRYGKRRGKVHWLLCKTFDTEYSMQKNCSASPRASAEKRKILWYFTIQTYYHRSPNNIVFIDKQKKDITVPGDQNVSYGRIRENRKIAGLAVAEDVNVKTTVVRLVLGALVTVSDQLQKHLKNIGS